MRGFMHMSEQVKKWGEGIPEYSDTDILSGIELHAFCTNLVAQAMQNEGYTIEGVILNDAPTQVIANKSGKRYFVIVAGDVFPNEGKISFTMKKRFSDFCKRENAIPMFASVGIMSIDSQRAATGLALKFDGYNVKYTGNEDLTNIKTPSPKSPDYRAYCVEQVIEAYSNDDFKNIYPLFARKIELHSQWVLTPNVGKTKVIDYYNSKSSALKNSKTKISGSSVVITETYKKIGNIGLISEPGKVCALLSQELDGKINWIFISLKFSKRNKIVEISINDPSLFNFKPYYAFD